MNEKSKEEVRAMVEAQFTPKENLQALEKAMYSSEFVDMAAMKAFHALEERLREDAQGLQLLNSMYMLLLYKSYVRENQEGLVKWFNNQMAAEAIGEISHLVRWEVE